MDCKECRELLGLLSRGKMSNDRMPDLREHLHKCKDCTEVWTELKNRASPDGRASAKSEDLVGKAVGGYKVVEMVGKGGMGTVYRATQISMNREVALKVLTGELARDSEYVQRFIREALWLPRLTTPISYAH